MKPGHSLAKAVSFLIAAGVVAAAIDFALFAARAASAKPEPGVRADAVVALTGGSGLRIAAGVDLVAAGQGQRLLISGVNDEVTLSQLAARTGGAEEIWDCCIDIGYAAETTLGNAEETAIWAKAHGYTSLIVVTSDYHMPRSEMVLADAMPDVRLTPWPVRTAINPEKTWQDWKTFRGLLTEWAKWRVTGLN